MSILYKYLPPQRIDFIDSLSLRITPQDALNDPYDCLPQFPSKEEYINQLIVSRDLQLKKIDSGKLGLQGTKDEIKRVFNIFQNLKEGIINNHPDGFDKTFRDSTQKYFNTKLGIISFSRIWNSNLMWSHYTMNHQGFSIGFDSNDDFIKQHRDNLKSRIYLTDVIYKNSRVKFPTIPNEIINQEFLYTKSEDWKYENETRMIVGLEMATKVDKFQDFDIHLLEFPLNTVKEICIGRNADSQIRMKLKDFAKANTIICYETILSEKDFDLDRVQIE